MILLTSCFFLPASYSHAQSISGAVGSLEITSSAANPAPGQTITVTARSYSISIDSANITWTAAGKTLAHGIGVTSVTMQAPALGKRTTISVTAAAADGQIVNGSVVIGSGSVDMIIEADGYVPPSFMGKLPLTYQNPFRVTAMPHLADASGKEYAPASLVYQWKKDDGTVFQDQSGYSKQSIDLVSSIIPRPYYLTVDVSTRDGSARAEGITSISAGAPVLSFYDNDPLYGPLYNQALGNATYVGSQRELGVLAVPYGFNMPTGNGLSWSWLINGQGHPELDGSGSVTLRAPADAAGSSDVEVDLTNASSILQRASANLSVTFGAAAAPDAASSITL